MVNNTTTHNTDTMDWPPLPSAARLPINRCNLPADILGSISFQRHPTALLLDGVAELHHELFTLLEKESSAADRAQRFMDYMTVHFRLEALEDAGLEKNARHKRGKADYLRILRGWLFDPDGRDAAVLKGWVESRFGLLPRHHRGPLIDMESDSYATYLYDRARGLYNTNALESQLDLLYTYCQYELNLTHPDSTHLCLYRGINHISEHEALQKRRRNRYIMLLNNINSFTGTRERADEFGDYILEADVPLSKIFFHHNLLPGKLHGEDEYVVIGGLYDVVVATF